MKAAHAHDSGTEGFGGWQALFSVTFKDPKVVKAIRKINMANEEFKLLQTSSQIRTHRPAAQEVACTND